MSKRIRRVVRVLIYGKDGRSDAIAAACVESKIPHELFAFSAFVSPGFRAKCKAVGTGDLNNLASMVDFAREIEPDLVIIGPEEPLAAGLGLVDALEDLGIPCFGPYKDLARIETSKAWTRNLLSKYKIPGNPEYKVFGSQEGLREYLEALRQFVVKPDGLTGGKGVKVFGEHLFSIDQAVTYAIEWIKRDNCVVIEERLEGEEFSLQSISDGETLLHCPIVQDHKRAHEGDRGPNTGGMGSYSCPDFSLPFLSRSDVERAKQINEAVAHAIREETGRPYRGVLYGGFMATSNGVRLIEYNARFADPEAMNLIAIMDSDFLELCQAAVAGRLLDYNLRFHHKATVCKYVVPEGYPDHPRTNEEILVPMDQLLQRGIKVYYAAVEEREGRIMLTGSRAVAFVGIGNTLEEAERLAEQGAASVVGPVIHRKDIGTDELVSARIGHMKRLRGDLEAQVSPREDRGTQVG